MQEACPKILSAGELIARFIVVGARAKESKVFASVIIYFMLHNSTAIPEITDWVNLNNFLSPTAKSMGKLGKVLRPASSNR